MEPIFRKTGFPLWIRFTFIYMLLQFVAPLQGQSLRGDLETYLNTYLENIPRRDGNDYTTLGMQQLADWKEMVTLIGQDKIEEARGIAENFDYQIIAYTHTGNLEERLYYLVEEKPPQKHFWGTYVVHASPCREQLIIQAPHPIHDSNTGKQAIYCFLRLEANALMLAGTHRCNHELESDCDGSTSVCTGTSSPYPISDMAHNVKSIFQKTTETLLEEVEDVVFLQLHGFAKRSTDPYVIMSNGTRVTPSVDYVRFLKESLQQQDPILSFKLAHIDQNWNRLIGFTNTQGRLINMSNDPCEESASQSKGQFIHLEQERSRLRENVGGWEKLRGALAEVFTCEPLAVISDMNSLFSLYPNPSSGSEIYITGTNILAVEIRDLQGALKYYEKFPATNSVELDAPGLSSGMYIAKILSGTQAIYKQLVVL